MEPERSLPYSQESLLFPTHFRINLYKTNKTYKQRPLQLLINTKTINLLALLEGQ